MTLKVYYLTTPDHAWVIEHGDSVQEDFVFQPEEGEVLYLRSENSILKYGTAEYREVAKKLGLPDFKNMNIFEWRFQSSAHPYLVNGSFPVHLKKYHQDYVYTVDKDNCRLRFRSGNADWEIMDNQCDSIADSLEKISAFEGGEWRMPWPVTATTNDQLREAVWTLAFWAMGDAGSIKHKGMPHHYSLEHAQDSENLDIFFDVDSDKISPKEQERLETFIKRYVGASSWLLEGYCDANRPHRVQC